MANHEHITSSLDSSDYTEPANMTFEQMYAAYYDGLIGFMKAQFTNIPESEHAEVVQEGMIKAMKQFDAYQDIGHSRKAWVYMIVKRTALDRIRANKIRTAEPSSDMFQYENVSDAAAEQDFMDVEVNAQVQIALDHVARVLGDKEKPDGWYAVFRLYAIEDMQYNEIAMTLNLTEGTVKSRINRIKKRLQFDAALREHFSKEPLQIPA